MYTIFVSSFRIAQVEYQGQTRHTRILDCKPLIDTYYHIGCRLELDFFSLQFFSTVEQLMNFRKVKTENLKLRTELQD